MKRALFALCTLGVGAWAAAGFAAPPVLSPGPVATDTGSAKPKGMDITYRTTASGLVIEFDGLRLEPKAEPVKTATGWDVKLTLHAAATDDRAHRLLESADCPLMVAGEIDKGGEQERFGDERKGDSEASVDRKGTSFTRDVKHPIAAGQSLTLHVGLWGVARDAADRKPVKKLFLVKMVAGTKKPAPVITPPE